LDKADEIVRKRKEAIALTEQLQKSIFLDMFGDPVINPKGWEKVTLGNLLAEELQNGAYFEKNYYTNDLTGVEMIHMSDAFYGTVTRGNLKRVLVSDAEVKKYQLNSDDILIARRSLNYEGAAKPCLIEDCCNPLIFESSLIRVRVKKNIINPIYLFSYMMQPRAREKYIYPYVTRSTISGINQAGLKKITIVVPPIALQNRFKEICNQIKKNSLKLELHLQESENLFNSLLQKAFKGEL
jgi:type I restriction enzyme S subunit